MKFQTRKSKMDVHWQQSRLAAAHQQHASEWCVGAPSIHVTHKLHLASCCLRSMRYCTNSIDSNPDAEKAAYAASPLPFQAACTAYYQPCIQPALV
jgi:hypothetical protein